MPVKVSYVNIVIAKTFVRQISFIVQKWRIKSKETKIIGKQKTIV